MIRGVHHEGSVVRNSGRPGLRIGLVALWALLQTPRVTGWWIAADARAGRAAEAWLYPGMVDVVIGVSAPVIAYLLWRRRGPWIWLVAVVWFTISIFDHTVAFANALATAIPTDFLGGNQPTVVTSLVIGAILDAAAIAALGARAAAKDEICRQADVITLHLRLGPETRGFLGRREFALMKPTAILVNTGRGALVERDALVDALGGGKIAGAGLDVFHDEPLKPGDPLTTFPGVVLSPHNAGQTPEVIRDGLLRAIENVENYLAGAPTEVVVAPVKARR